MESVAIVGSGIAGMTASWQLKDMYKVTVFESEKELGGQAKTVSVETPERVIDVDMAVQVFSENSYPNLFELLALLDIPTYISPLSFSAYFPLNQESWHNFCLETTELGRRLTDECDRFHLDMYNVSQEYGHYVSYDLRQFLDEKKYSTLFISKALFPKLSILAGSRASLMDFSLGYCAALFNLRLLSFFTPPQWRRINGGVKILINSLENTCKNKVIFKKNCGVNSVRRTLTGVEVVDKAGETHTFDKIIFATHAGIVLELLMDPSPQEKRLLGSFQYDYATSVVHTSSSILADLGSNDFRNYASCFYRYDLSEVNYERLGSTTFNIGSIASLKKEMSSLFMSINPEQRLPDESIVASTAWKHPKLRPSDMKIKQAIGKEQGKRNTWFCGLDISTTGHEGALVSGLVIAEAFKSVYPFSHKPAAKGYFEEVKRIMGM